jgi:hypothetical protein
MAFICLNTHAHTSSKGLTDSAVQCLQGGSTLCRIIAGPHEIHIDGQKKVYFIPRMVLNSSFFLNSSLPVMNNVLDIIFPLALDDVDNDTFKLYLS